MALRPVTDGDQAWVALLLDAQPWPDESAQRHLFADLGLAAALDGMPCVVAIDHAGGTSAEVPVSDFLQPMAALPASDLTSALPASIPRPVMATGVDSYSLFERCRKAGAAWFAGNYPLRPIPGTATRNAARHALILQLLAMLADEAETRELEEVIRQEPQLSYQLLRLVNSVAYAPGQAVTSFAHAITLLGRKPMQRWLQVLLYARAGDGGASPLLPRAAMRAACMEALFATAGPAEREQAFVVGMFSLLDVMLNESLATLLGPLRLPVEANRALMEGGGPYGLALRAVAMAETGDPGPLSLADALLAAGLDATTWNRALVGACHWAVRVSRAA